MRTIVLESFRDESTGTLGLSISGMPRDWNTNAAYDGLLIAHDLIEHVNGPERIGSIDDELEALGAIWYVRGQHSDLRRPYTSHYSAEENISSDIVRMYRDHIAGGASVEYIGLRTKPCAADEALSAIIEYAARDYAGEFSEDELDSAHEGWEAFAGLCLHRMRTGYRKAHKKWERKGRYAANSQFWAIADAVDPYTKSVEFEGMRYKLSFGNGEAFCDELYDEGSR